jgi:hypothetical protein
MKDSRSYQTGSALRTALEERLARIARRESIDLQRLRRQVAFDRVLARLARVPGNPWVLKGGYAMELRYRKARSTKDLDFTMRFEPPDQPETDAILESVREAAAADLGDFFAFRIGKATADLQGAPYGGARFPVEAVLGGRTFARFHLDIGVGDVVMEPVETARCRDWLGFARIPPPTPVLVSPEQQLAEKLHAYTFPRPDIPNSRVRDLVDMFLLIDSGTLSTGKARQAVANTFSRRNTHPVPARLQSPGSDWEQPFKILAAECGIPENLDLAFQEVADFFHTLKE